MAKDNKSSKSTNFQEFKQQQIDPSHEKDFLIQDWEIYFDSALYPRPNTLKVDNNIHLMIIAFYDYRNYDFYNNLFKWPQKNSAYCEISVNYDLIQKICLSDHKSQELQTFAELMGFFREKPQLIISCMSLALHHISSTKEIYKNKKIFICFYNFSIVELVDIKSHMVENFIASKVIVLKVNHIKLLAIAMEFKCLQCKRQFLHYFSNGIYSLPNKCKAISKKGCNGKSFNPDKCSLKTVFYQKIKVQQIDSEGRVPRIIEVELRQNLVGKTIAGDTIIISGILKTEACQQRDKKTQGIFTPIILANSIKNQKVYKTTQNQDITIKQMRSNKKIFISLIKSFCPTIYGNQLVKAGLLLGIIGGSSKGLISKTNFRQSSHILLLGDPGLGKSQMLKFASNLLPHSLYISGNAISNSGLTVTINKQANNESSLQAGALVLCDRGVCAIDQFDKITDSFALLQVMQQQTVSIAKSGIICQLQSRVSIIGSANPLNGSYMKTKSLKDNIKISNAILSRFDLIFLLLDNPDPQRDKKLSQHIMKIHRKNKKIPYQQLIDEKFAFCQEDMQFKSLQQKYSILTQEVQEAYTLEQMKIYLNYVKNQIHPVLHPEAANAIKIFFMTLREENLCSSFPITTRQLQSLIRLSMARARLECRTQVTKEDAQQIIQFMQQSLFDALQDMSTGINNLRNEMKKKMKTNKQMNQLSIPKQTKFFIQRLNELKQQKCQSVFQFNELMKIAKQLGMSVGDFDNYLQKLNIQGYLLQKGGRKYQLKYKPI